MTRTETIKAFLTKFTWPDLAEKYSHDMEVQVNVHKADGERIEGEFKGRSWVGYSNGIASWKPFRIPYSANTEPNYPEDKPLTWPIELYAEGIGMTGWNWKYLQSIYVAYDFDAVVDHKHLKTLSENELQNLYGAVKNVPWVSVRKSTSGTGLHLYVYLAQPVETSNHNEHAALARAILSKLSGEVGVNLSAKVDTCGGNLWVWHKKMTAENQGLKLIKEGEPLKDVPANWRSHYDVVTHRAKKIILPEIKDVDIFNDLVNQTGKVPLDEEHLRLVHHIQDKGWWESDLHMLITHTTALKDAHSELGLKGIFDTVAKGTESNDHNCFMYPIRRGAWVVRRYTRGVAEARNWEQDGQGWTRCYFNKVLELPVLAKIYGGIETPKGGYVFSETEMAQEVANNLGANLKLPPWIMSRKAVLAKGKNNNIVFSIDFNENDVAATPPLTGWLLEKRNWIKVIKINNYGPNEPQEMGSYDDIVRHLVTAGREDSGWVLRVGGEWNFEPINHVRDALIAHGFKLSELSQIIGGAVIKCWTLVNEPFKEEYLGDRIWNKDAAQLKYIPNPDKDNLFFPTWNKILEHTGQSLDRPVQEDPWCQQVGLKTGKEYLKCWIASLIQYPLEPLPYLFFYGPQNSGKSVFHEALALLFTRGCVRAETALTSTSGFNGELANSVLCVLEEIDLKTNKGVYNRIKDWVTSRDFTIHVKNQTPFSVPNSSHWVHCSNDHLACPILPGDTRIVVIHVPPLKELIPKRELFKMLEKEAPDFTAEVLSLELPKSNDRLNIPVIMTESKAQVEQHNKTHIAMFIDECCKHCPGAVVKFSDFYDKYTEWLAASDRGQLVSKIKVGRELPPEYPKGRIGAPWFIGNLSFDMEAKPHGKYILVGETLKLIEDNG